MSNTNQIQWVVFSFLLRLRHKGEKVDLGGMGNKCIQGALYEIPKSLIKIR